VVYRDRPGVVLQDRMVAVEPHKPVWECFVRPVWESVVEVEAEGSGSSVTRANSGCVPGAVVRFHLWCVLYDHLVKCE
jgi:hypothetical protein